MILDFEKYPSGENCPIGRIITTLEKCKKASAVLGLRYLRDYNNPDRPAGCYWKEDQTLISTYFNAIVEPSKTKPESFDATGGVCDEGKLFYCHRTLFV